MSPPAGPRADGLVSDENRNIVVLFATYNGRDVIGKTLDGYCAIRPPECSWRILVVDNGSSDDTASLAASYADRLPITIVSCATPGKNNALNAGLEYAKDLHPSLYIFTDDDAVPDEDFLLEWREIDRSLPGALLFGGTITPIFLSKAEPWLEEFRFVYHILYALNVGDNRIIAAGDIYGPNMAVRSEVFEKGFLFNVDIGPNSRIRDYPMGSETEFCVRVARELGAVCRFVAGPKVGHLVRGHQATKRYIAGRAFRHGRGYAFQKYMNQSPPHTLMNDLAMRVKDIVMSVTSKLAPAKLFWRCHWGMGYRSEIRAITAGAKTKP